MTQSQEKSDLVLSEYRCFRMDYLPESIMAEICSYFTVKNVFKLPCVWKNIEIPFTFWRDRLGDFIDLDPRENSSQVNKKLHDFRKDIKRRFNNMESVLVSLRFANDERVKLDLIENLRFLESWVTKMARIQQDKVFRSIKIMPEPGTDISLAPNICFILKIRRANNDVPVLGRSISRFWDVAKEHTRAVVHLSKCLQYGSIKFARLKYRIQRFKEFREYRQEVVSINWHFL